MGKIDFYGNKLAEGSLCKLLPQSAHKICQSRAMFRFCSVKLSHLDVKYNNLSFDDPNWVIPIEEETL